MTEALSGFPLGLAVGALYFGALWLTVVRIPGARRPGMLVLGSYLARLTLVGMGFYAVLRLGGATTLVSALVGFVVMRQVLLHRIRKGVRGPEPEGAPWS